MSLHPHPNVRVPNFFAPVQKILTGGILKIISTYRNDITKACAKYALCYCIQNQIIVQWGKFRITTDHCISYGCEAAWAAYYQGSHSVPGTLIKYACIDFCYDQTAKCARLAGLDYPESIKSDYRLAFIAQLIVPLAVRQSLSWSIDYGVHYFEEEEIDYDALASA